MHPRVKPGGDDLCAICRHWLPTGDYADFLLFLSSSTSVNSASTTSSFLPSAPVALSLVSGPGAPSAPACCALYIASPSFIEACASVLLLALIASASSPLSASLRSAIAF